jgi:Protein of unknown function (DUF3800)
MNYRLYIDEVGNSDLGSSKDPNHRYLSLTGIILNFEYVLTTVFPVIEGLKRDYFGSHPDEPVIPHRKELVNKKHPFESLREPFTEISFNESLLNLLQNLDYAVITVVIDKSEHYDRYQVWHFDPYHYCLTVMVERFVLWLKRKNATGDVMAESRGGEEDRRLKAAFEKVYIDGSDFVEADTFASRLTSRQLKVKPKDKNIAGLQLADIVAHPSFHAALARKELRSLPENFGGKIGKILEDNKYVRSPDGDIDGWGRKWLP